MPENASLPPHCMPTSSLDSGSSVRLRSFSRASFRSARAMIRPIMSSMPAQSCSVIRQSGPRKDSSSSISGRSFSQPSATHMTSPPKLGCLTRLRSVRIGTFARER